MMLAKKLLIAGLLAASCSANAISLWGATVQFQGHSYTEVTADSWTNSEAFAITQGGHLVAVNSQAENDFLISTFGSNNALWIGMYRTGPFATDFAWSNGDAVSYTNWAGGEPNNAGGFENYVHTYTNGQWNDLPDWSDYAGPKFGVIETAGVPESSTLGLLLVGVMGLIARRRAAK